MKITVMVAAALLAFVLSAQAMLANTNAAVPVEDPIGSTNPPPAPIVQKQSSPPAEPVQVQSIQIGTESGFRAARMLAGFLVLGFGSWMFALSLRSSCWGYASRKTRKPDGTIEYQYQAPTEDMSGGRAQITAWHCFWYMVFIAVSFFLFFFHI